MKQPKKKKGSLGILVAIALIIYAVISLALVVRKNEKALEKSSAASMHDYRTRLTGTCKSYMQACTHRDKWWIEEATLPTPELSYELNNALTRIRDAITSSAAASPLAQQIALTYKDFLITEYMNGQAIAIVLDGVKPQKTPNTLEVCFISENEYRKSSLWSMLWFHSNWDAVMMGAIEWPRPMFDSMLMHEVGHAHWKKTKGQPSNFSHEWFVDEVTMHELGTAVFDHHTDKQYSKKLKSICTNHANTKNAAEFLASVTVEELLELDKIVGIRDSGHDVRGAACTHHITTLGFTFIDLRKGSLDDKIAHYMWVIEKLPRISK